MTFVFSPNNLWKDGKGKFHFGSPFQSEIWKDNSGIFHFGSPNKKEEEENWKDE
jgi:hypothetical protein